MLKKLWVANYSESKSAFSHKYQSLRWQVFPDRVSAAGMCIPEARGRVGGAGGGGGGNSVCTTIDDCTGAAGAPRVQREWDLPHSADIVGEGNSVTRSTRVSAHQLLCVRAGSRTRCAITSERIVPNNRSPHPRTQRNVARRRDDDDVYHSLPLLPGRQRRRRRRARLPCNNRGIRVDGDRKHAHGPAIATMIANRAALITGLVFVVLAATFDRGECRSNSATGAAGVSPERDFPRSILCTIAAWIHGTDVGIRKSRDSFVMLACQDVAFRSGRGD